MKNNEVICTVLMISYNHAQYIKEAIDSVLSQKTKYNFKIHIFDDNSTDGSKDIIRDYARKYPSKIKAFISDENRGAQENIWNAYKSVDTKYCCYLETDDYWIDDEKLELQIDTMEENPECSFGSANTLIKVIKDECLSDLDETLQINCSFENNVLSIDDVLDKSFQTHVSSRIIRMSDVDLDRLENFKEAFLYDASQYLYMMSKGKMYWLNRTVSVYRKTGEGSASGAKAGIRTTNFLKAMTDLNYATDCKIWKVVASQINRVLNYWVAIDNDSKLEESEKVYKTYLFGFLPFLSKTCSENGDKYKIFGISFLRVREKKGRKHIKLFGLPFLKVKTTRKLVS